MKIAFKLISGDSWYGGISYLGSLFYVLRYSCKDKLILSLLVTNDRGDIPSALSRNVDELIHLEKLRRWTMSWFLNKAMEKVTQKNLQLENILRQHKVDALFGTLLNTYIKIPTLSWIPDFQHIHLPEMFTDEERKERDEGFVKTAKLSTRVILMSESVKNDFEKFAPEYRHKARVLKTVTPIPETVYESDLDKILNLYNIPEKFIYLPNQFWKHKNHELVFNALKILKDRGSQVLLVCTGFPGDYRHTGYFAGLFQKLSEWGIRNQVIYLGMIPYEHVLLLMRQSICVVNSSLFEGFGLTLSEAKSLGKQVLLSDIPVHREQNPAKAVFFNPYDAEGLAEKISEVWNATKPGPDIELEFEARQNVPERLRLCAESFLSILHELNI